MGRVRIILLLYFNSNLVPKDAINLLSHLLLGRGTRWRMGMGRAPKKGKERQTHILSINIILKYSGCRENHKLELETP